MALIVRRPFKSGPRRGAPRCPGPLRPTGQRIAVGLLLVTLALAGGCATTRSVQDTVGGWFGGTPTPSPKPVATPAQAARAYYVGVDRLKVHNAPNASAEVVGELSYRDQVMRSRVERGFAHVKATGSGLTGWVDNAALVRRQPAVKAGAAPPPAAVPAEEPSAPEPEEPTAPEAPAPMPTDTPAPAALPEPTPTPRGSAPSMFDPF